MVSISSSSSTGSNSKAISRRPAVSMGACFSTVGLVLCKGAKGRQLNSASAPAPPLSCSSTAKIISVDGDLREYKVPITVSEVLQAQFPTSPSSYFLCNSDCLYYNDSIPAMSSNDPLLANQIYFLLPASKINTRLSAADMAALAVKASAALQNISNISSSKSKRRSKNKNNTQISPLLSEARKDFDHYREISGLDKPFSKAGGNSTASGGGFTRSGSVRKLHRYTSKRAKMAVRSFRLRLSTIYEGTVVH